MRCKLNNKSTQTRGMTNILKILFMVAIAISMTVIVKIIKLFEYLWALRYNLKKVMECLRYLFRTACMCVNSYVVRDFFLSGFILQKWITNLLGSSSTSRHSSEETVCQKMQMNFMIHNETENWNEYLSTLGFKTFFIKPDYWLWKSIFLEKLATNGSSQFRWWLKL